MWECLCGQGWASSHGEGVKSEEVGTGKGLPLLRRVNLDPGPDFFNSQHTHLPNSENSGSSREGCCKSEKGRMNGNCETCYTMAGMFPPKTMYMEHGSVLVE